MPGNCRAVRLRRPPRLFRGSRRKTISSSCSRPRDSSYSSVCRPSSTWRQLFISCRPKYDVAFHLIRRLVASSVGTRNGHGARPDQASLSGRSMTRKLVVVAAGGTGGHFFPRRGASTRVALARLSCGDRDRSAWARVCRQDRRGCPPSHSCGRFDAGIAGKIVGIAELALGTIEARRLLRGLNPACAVGFGGYPLGSHNVGRGTIGVARRYSRAKRAPRPR